MHCSYIKFSEKFIQFFCIILLCKNFQFSCYPLLQKVHKYMLLEDMLGLFYDVIPGSLYLGQINEQEIETQ